MLPTARTLAQLLVLCLTALGLSGCWDAIPIEERGVVIAIGVDPASGSTLERWTFVLPNVTATASDVSSLAPSQQLFSVDVHAGGWNTAQEALATRLSRLPYFGQLEAVVVSDRLPAERVSSIVSDLNAESGIPKSYFVVGAHGSAAELASTVWPDEVVPRYWLKSYFSCGTCHALDLRRYGWQWWADHEAGGRSPFIPVFQLVHRLPKLAGVDVYPSVGPPVRMPDGAAQGLALLLGRARALSLTTALAGRSIQVQRLTVRAKTDAAWTPTGVQVDVHMAALGVFATSLPVKDPEIFLHAAQSPVARALLGRSEEAVGFANRTHTDPFGWNERAALTAREPMGWPNTLPVTLESLAAHLTVHVQLKEQGVYGE